MTAGAAGAVPRCVGGIAGTGCESIGGAVVVLMVWWWCSVVAVVVVLVADSVSVWAWVSMVGGGR